MNPAAGHAAGFSALEGLTAQEAVQGLDDAVFCIRGNDLVGDFLYLGVGVIHGVGTPSGLQKFQVVEVIAESNGVFYAEAVVAG